MLIGGAVSPGPNEPIFQHFLKLTEKSSDLRLTIIPTASNEISTITKFYEKKFQSLDVTNIQHLIVENRKDSQESKYIDIIKHETDAIFFTGGDQLRLTSILGGSPLLDAINAHIKSGKPIAGTSAGAAAVPDTMISWGDPGTFNKGLLQMSPGLGIVRDMVIDTHFIKRGRITRLLHMVVENPGILGIGLSEATAILLSQDEGCFEVFGSGSVIVVDGRSIIYSNVSQIPVGKSISVQNVILHALSEGHIYNYLTHEIVKAPDYVSPTGNFPEGSI